MLFVALYRLGAGAGPKRTASPSVPASPVPGVRANQTNAAGRPARGPSPHLGLTCVLVCSRPSGAHSGRQVAAAPAGARARMVYHSCRAPGFKGSIVTAASVRRSCARRAPQNDASVSTCQSAAGIWCSIQHPSKKKSSMPGRATHSAAQEGEGIGDKRSASVSRWTDVVSHR